MAQPDHQIIRDFLEWTRTAREYAILEPGGDKRRAFIPLQKVQTYFEGSGSRGRGSRRIFEILDVVFFPESPPLYAENVIPKYITIFCILVHINKGRFIPQFTEYDDLCDDRLPFDPDDKPSKFPPSSEDPEFFSRFCEEQWKWCPPKLQRHMLNKRFGEKRVLPIVFKTRLGGGGSATLYKIKLHRDYNNLIADEDKLKLSQEASSTFALKTYITDEARKYYENEVAAFHRLRQTQNMIEFYGSYIHGETYNIVLEYADKGSLEDYFSKKQDPIPEPTTGKDIISFWRSLSMILQALAGIHKVKPWGSSEGPGIFEGWHQDVKPENILIVSKGATSPYEWQFKLGDLGLSHFQRGIGTSGNSTARAAHGTRTYGAPECYISDEFVEQNGLDVKQSVDIWSLGCVFSEAAIWVARGLNGLTKYREERKAETDKLEGFKDGDCFHNGFQTLQAVHKCHRNAVESLRSQDYITQQVINTMIKPMLEVEDRPTAMQLWRTANRILKEAEDNLSQGLDPFIRGDNGRANTFPIPRPKPPPPPVTPFDAPGMPHAGEVITDEEDNSMMTDYEWNSPANVLSNRDSAIWRDNGAPNHHYASAESLRDRRGKGKSVSFGTSAVPKIAQGEPSESAGATQRGTESPAAYQATTFDAPPLRPSTPPHRPPAVNAFSAPSGGSALTTDKQMDQTRSVSDPTVPQTNSMQSLIPPNTSPSSSRVVDHQRGPSHASSSQYSQHQHTASQDSSASSKADHLSLKQALDWRKKRKLGIKVALPEETRLRWLKKRDQVFLIDDSKSMEPYSKSIIDVVAALSYIVKDCDPDGTELHFTISSERRQSKDTKDFLNMLSNKTFNGETDIDACLNEILDKYTNELRHGPWWRKSVRNFVGGQKGVRPLSLYVLTNGVWQSKSTGEKPILNLVRTLRELGKTRSQVGIQFISFGNDPVGLERMRYLDSGLQGDRKKEEWLDIVDTTPSDGKVWKMLLGAINDTFDGDDEEDGGGVEDDKRLSNFTSSPLSSPISPLKSSDR